MKPWGIFSSCNHYRYVLAWPTGLDNDLIALGVFANPSTATPEQLDPTLTRWLRYCRDWGYGWSHTVNVRAWRETNPKLLPDDPQAIGEDNDGHILDQCHKADLIVCGWGNLGGTQGDHVLSLIRSTGKVPHALKMTTGGNPGHPLYLRADLKPFPIENKS